jgi:hypothetical protein
LRTARSALAAAARAVEADDGRALFQALDCRSRAALHSISRDRRAAARLIRAEYPSILRDSSLRPLGDAASARDAADLFSTRCRSACRAHLAAQLGAPVAQDPDGDEATVRTVRGGLVRLHRCDTGQWGLVWHTRGLDEERRHAARELVQIERNAQVYRRRRALADALSRASGTP